MLISDESLTQALTAANIIDPKKLSDIAKEAKEKKSNFVDLLLNSELISDEKLGILIADFLKLPFITLSKVSIPLDILNIVPQIVAKKQSVIAFAKEKETLKLAMANPQNTEITHFIEKKTGMPIKIYYATQKDIANTLSLYRKEIQKNFDELFKQEVTKATIGGQVEAPIEKIVNLFIEYAYENKSSDIHIEPKDSTSLVRFRIDGILHDVLRLPMGLHDRMITRIKVLARLRTDEHLSAQDGKMQLSLEEENLDIRVSIVPIVEGEKAVLRLLSSRSRQFSLTDLGMNQADLEKVKSGFAKPYGMVLSSGPTGSGKTTTIYSILKIINTREKNIATIEDPVEYDIEGINQIQVNPKSNLTFAAGLRAILRQDPDIIFVGEIRDGETAEIAINSAMTGHLVLSTIHTNDAATTLPRLIDMKIEPFLIASTANVIIGQRLVRKICENCKYSQVTTSADLVKKIPAELVKMITQKKDIRIYEGKGCEICHMTGYVGRIGIFEVLVVTDKIRQLINAKNDADSIKKQAVAEGMSTMLKSGIEKVENGITTMEEVLRATRE